jgi:hypothetical protein
MIASASAEDSTALESLAGTIGTSVHRLFRPALGWSSGKVWRTKPLRQVEDAKACAKRIPDYRTFPNGNVERPNKYVASFCCIMSYDSNDIID